MLKTLLHFLIFFALVLPETNTATAQLFGQRSLGGSLSKRSAPGASASPGTIDGNRRFLREQRDVLDFVGAGAAAGGDTGFVGGASAVSTATSSVTGLREEVRPPLNRPRIVRNNGIYPERLSLSPDLKSEPTAFNEVTTPSKSTVNFIQRHSLMIEVSAEDHVATLQGEVPSEHDRRLVEAYVMLEPGIRTVVNRLTVNPSAQNSPGATKRRRESDSVNGPR